HLKRILRVHVSERLCATALERELDAELYAPAVPGEEILAESRVQLLTVGVEARHGVDAGPGSVGAAELRVVERIVSFEAELDASPAFVPLEIFHHRHVPIVNAGSAERILRRISASELIARRKHNGGGVKGKQRAALVFRKHGVGYQIGPHAGSSRRRGQIHSQAASTGDIGN